MYFIIAIGRERFEAPECLFNPSYVENEMPGISDMIIETCDNSPFEIRKTLYGYILLSGGTTLFPGFPTRIINDIKHKFV